MSLFADVALPVTAIPPGDSIHLEDGVTVELERVVPTASDVHYFWLVGEHRDRTLTALRAASTVDSLAPLDVQGDRVLVRVHWSTRHTPFLDLLDEHDVLLVDATGTAAGWEATLRFPDEGALEAFYGASERVGLSVEIRTVHGEGVDDGRSVNALSTVQRETLEAAFEAGYFEIPRKTTLAELAARLDRSEQAVFEALRRAMANYLTATLHGATDGEETDRSVDGDRATSTDTADEKDGTG